MKTAIMMGIVLFFAVIWARASDLDKEVNAFQVKLVSEKAYLANMKKAKKQSTIKKAAIRKSVRPAKVVAKTKKATKVQSETSASPYDDSAIKVESSSNDNFEISSPSISYVARPETRSASSGFFLRATALPQFMFSAFDGGDDGKVSPRGLGDSMKNGFAGNVTMDMNLFKHDSIVIEGGISYLSMGAKTGIKQEPQILSSFQQPGFNQFNTNLNSVITYEDDVKSQYLGLIIAAKWYAAGIENDSSLYVRAGILPMFLMSKETSQGAGYYPYNPYYNNNQFVQNNDSRFGGINTFDVAAQLGIGYSFKIMSDISLVADITGTQGFLPVMNNYSVYNAALAAGLGISYKL